MTTTTKAAAKDRAVQGDEKDAKIEALEAQLAELVKRDQAPASTKVAPPRETHVLVLANGEIMRTASPVATHHAGEDGKTYPVVTVYELGEED